MKILAIESSGPLASAAVIEEGRILGEEAGEFKVTHSETLLPLTDKVIKETGTDLKEIDAIAVSGGPGSFTGLRIGNATAKGLGLALEKPLIHVPTLEAMAYNFYETANTLVIPLMDARRNQVYTGIYRFKCCDMEVLLTGCAMSIEDLISLINEKYAGENIIFSGDGVPVARELIESSCRAGYTFAEGPDAFQRAASVARLGERLALAGKTVNADDEAPEYLRPSQAERVKAEKDAAKEV